MTLAPDGFPGTALTSTTADPQTMAEAPVPPAGGLKASSSGGTLAGTESGRAFVALAEAVGDGLVEVDATGLARALNVAGRALLPLTGGQDGGMAPKALFDLLAASRSEGRVVTQDIVAQIPVGEAQGRAPGSRHVRIAALVREDTRLVALRDSTEERLLQERLLQSEKMASVGQLVSGVAHELNNPLTGVMGFAQLLLSRDLDESSRAQVRTIYGEAERAAKIVQNLLSFARRRRPSKEMADVNALLAQVLELRSYDFAIRNISLDMELDQRMPRCWLDPDQVQQVFFNVVKNAEQAMLEANGGGRLTVRTEAIGEHRAKGNEQGGIGEQQATGSGLRATGPDSGMAAIGHPSGSQSPESKPKHPNLTPAGVRITIADDGPGIPLEVQRRIFDPFFTTKEAGHGTGLGLTISYNIVDEHGGRVWVESGAGAGSAFIIELPAEGPPSREEQRPAGEGQRRTEWQPAIGDQQQGIGTEARTSPRYRILVVDDEESIRVLLRDILEMDGHGVEVATSGIEAWDRLDGGDFDVIITDMKMPGMDGATFYRELRGRDPTLAARIVFITGDTVSPDTRAFLQTVPNPVLSKPFKIAPLRDAMESVLTRT